MTRADVAKLTTGGGHAYVIAEVLTDVIGRGIPPGNPRTTDDGEFTVG